MQARVGWLPFMITLVLTVGIGVLPVSTYAQESGAEQNPRNRSVGAPQTLKLPVQSAPTDLSVPIEPPPPSQPSDFGDFDPNASWPPSTADSQFPDWPEPSLEEYSSLEEAALKRTYLGVLYATAEEGPEGVRVLSVIEGSPAARAGFEGVNTPVNEKKSNLMKAAIVVLAMSPAGPFVMPLAIAHDILKNRHPPGDLIVAVENTTVRNAQEFTEAMQRYQPGDSVPFKVLRKDQLLQITVALEEEPL